MWVGGDILVAGAPYRSTHGGWGATGATGAAADTSLLLLLLHVGVYEAGVGRAARIGLGVGPAPHPPGPLSPTDPAHTYVLKRIMAERGDAVS